MVELSGKTHSNESTADAQTQLETIFSFNIDGFVSFNTQKQVARVNPAFVKMTGINNDVWQGLNEADFRTQLFALCHAEDMPDNAPWSSVLHFSRPDTTTQSYAACTITPTISATGSFMHFHEITYEYKEKKQLKSDFLATTAHTLRTPIASVQGFSELLLNNSFDASVQKEIFEIIREESIKMIALINALVNSSHTETTNLK